MVNAFYLCVQNSIYQLNSCFILRRLLPVLKPTIKPEDIFPVLNTNRKYCNLTLLELHFTCLTSFNINNCGLSWKLFSYN